MDFRDCSWIASCGGHLSAEAREAFVLGCTFLPSDAAADFKSDPHDWQCHGRTVLVSSFNRVLRCGSSRPWRNYRTTEVRGCIAGHSDRGAGHSHFRSKCGLARQPYFVEECDYRLAGKL